MLPTGREFRSRLVRRMEMNMAWETPIVTEIDVAMEVTAYVSSEGDSDDRID